MTPFVVVSDVQWRSTPELSLGELYWKTRVQCSFSWGDILGCLNSYKFFQIKFEGFVFHSMIFQYSILKFLRYVIVLRYVGTTFFNIVFSRAESWGWISMVGFPKLDFQNWIPDIESNSWEVAL